MCRRIYIVCLHTKTKRDRIREFECREREQGILIVELDLGEHYVTRYLWLLCLPSSSVIFTIRSKPIEGQ